MAIAGCALDKQGAPSLTGPSELALSVTTSADPDVLTQDGQSRSQIKMMVRGANGQPDSTPRQMRLDIVVGGQVVDFGTLSSKSVFTGSDGTAMVLYTAPPAPAKSSGGPDPVVAIVITPVGWNYGNTTERNVLIRLTAPGVILPPNGTPVPKFVASPTTPRVGDKVTFDASTSTDDGTIVSYAWNFGDGDSATGVIASNRYELAGSYNVTLTVTDDRGLKATTAPTTITVGPTDAPTADFSVSPETAKVGQAVFVNGSLSKAAAGHRVDKYEWDFGDGGSGSGVTFSHVYTAVGTYSIVLKVTDDFGLEHAVVKTVTIIP
jgi:PKD repeat protein